MRFSKLFIDKTESLKTKGYNPKNAIINFILYWKKEGSEREILIALPEVFFEKS